MHSSHLAGIVSAVLLSAALPGAAMAHAYPPNTNCSQLEGTDHLACIKQIDHMQRSGAHPAPSNAEASVSTASTAGSRAGTTGANTGFNGQNQHD